MNSHAFRRQRFDALFEAHKVDVASYCSWRSASRADAEDAVAEVFLVAWRKIDLIPRGDGARAWLYATARRVTANARRSIRRRDALDDRMSQDRSVNGPQPDVTSEEDALVHEARPCSVSETERSCSWSSGRGFDPPSSLRCWGVKRSRLGGVSTAPVPVFVMPSRRRAVSSRSQAPASSKPRGAWRSHRRGSYVT